MSRGRRIVLIVALLVVSTLLALLLRSIVYEVVVVPVAFLGFQLGIWYHSLSQGLWWWLIIALVLLMIAFSLIPPERSAKQRRIPIRPKRGPVEQLATEMGRAESGRYFKWIVANRLGRLAYQMLLHRESGRQITRFEPLVGEGWQAPPELQTYLEVGLRGSFADYPSPKNPLATPARTPLDHNITKAVEFLESQVENRQLQQ